MPEILEELKTRHVQKRGGEITPFYAYKINWILQRIKADNNTQAVIKQSIIRLARQNLDEPIKASKIAKCFIDRLPKKQAKAYHDYHEQEVKSFAQATDPSYKLSQYFSGDSNIINENANKDHKLYNTQRDLIAGTVSRAIGLKMLPDIVAKAHQRGDIHWHDLDYSPVLPETNCSLPDFKDMLAHGFQIGNANVSSPKSIETAVALIVQAISEIAGLQYGGQSINRADELLAPYAKLNYDKHLREAEQFAKTDEQESFAKERTKKDIYDAMQSLEYEINTLFSSQGQTPFVTVNFGLGTSWIEREIQKDILDIRIKGLGKDRRTAVFPKLIFTIKKGLNLNPCDPNYDIKQKAVLCATRRMYPDILNYDKVIEITGSFKTCMGCRSFLQGWINPETGKDEEEGRMNLGVVTVNLPRIALEANGDKKLFWEIFKEKLNICHTALRYRIARCKEAKPDNAPLLFEQGAFGKRLKPDDDVDQLFRNSRATVSLGYIGIYEVVTTFYGPDWEHNKEAHDFAISITHEMHKLCQKWESEEGYHYSLYSTPAESLTNTFCQADIKKFGKIKDITDKEYYTNSFHYDVRKHPTPFEKLTFEEDFPYDAAGGFIHYCEYPNLRQNPKALEAVWDWSYNHVAYLGTNTAIDKCYVCGYAGEFTPTKRSFKCPVCGNRDPNKCDCVRRTCGYLGNPMKRPMVHGRHEEIIHRVKHMNPQAAQQVANFEKTRQMEKGNANITGKQII